MNSILPTYNSAPRRSLVAILPSLLTVVFVASACHSLVAFELNEAELATRFEKRVRSIVTEHCKECHSKDLAEADIDLTEYQTLADIQRNLIVWQKVAEMLDSNQMPPKDAKQLSEPQRKELRSWLDETLTLEARRTAGDPGPVVLRRLNNAEYTYTLRDITEVKDLQPAKEFPVDGAAGEGFTNAGNALSMSPALLSKYLEAGKEVASHAVLLPDGIRFSPSSTRRDWTEELLTDIRQLYARYSAKEGETQVNLQGIVFETNGGGRLPIDQYLSATLEERDALKAGSKSIAAVAEARGLSAKYLSLLWNELTRKEPSHSLLLDELRNQWQKAEAKDVTALTTYISQWQKTLWRFSSVGHIGKVNGPKSWLEATNPMAPRQELRSKLPTAEPGKDVSIYLVAGDAGDGNADDFAVWERPRLVAPGRADLLLKDVRRVASELQQVRDQIFRDAAKCLAAADEVSNSSEPIDTAALAKKYQLPATSLQAWFDYLGIGTRGPVKIDAPLTRTTSNLAGYDFIQGWVGDDALSIVANSSDQAVRIPGNMKPHSVAVHPSPTLQIAVGWQCPEATAVQIEGSVQHAHPECGNGVAWTVELRRGNTRQRLAVGTSQGARGEKFGPFKGIAVQPGDIVALVISPRDANHSCDLTAIELTLKNDNRTWNLAEDVSPNILAGNPHADQFGNKQVWHFYSEPTQGSSDHVIPANSLLARWQATSDRQERTRLAEELQQLLASGSDPKNTIASDIALLQQLKSLSGPLLAAAMKSLVAESTASSKSTSTYGLDETLFGKHPQGGAIDAGSLCVKAPTYIEVKLPADLVAGSELVTSGSIHPGSNEKGSVQFAILTEKPAELAGLQAIAVTEQVNNGVWTSNNRSIAMSSPIVVAEASPARDRLMASFDAFRQLFPGALCYTKIVPVDEVVTLTLYYREDEMLQRLMLSEAEIARLNRLWNELHFVSQDAFMSVDAYEQLWQYATQDADPSAFEPLRKPLLQRAEEFRAELIAAEPLQIDAVLKFAEQAYRRPLSDAEQTQLRKLYGQLRSDELPHDSALRMLLARVLISPAFLYRAESGNLAERGTGTIPSRQLTDEELATRLSYFLWSTGPDQRLRTLAQEGRLHEPEVLLSETRRLLQDERVRRLATEFMCQWIQIYDFDAHDEKSEIAFPTFHELRGAMYEEAIRYFADLYQRDGSVLELIDADHTFVNGALAQHYALNSTEADWHRIDAVRSKGRGGILGMAATLSKQAGASRTSPILRGNWISEVLIGEKLPKPPKNVPLLPETVPGGLTERQLIEQHSADPACAKCHARIDPFGFSLENFDGIGRWRGGPEINSITALADGTELAGYEGLKSYLLNQRRKDFVRQFCKKSLGYALGRAVQLSDEPLLADMQKRLEANNYRISLAVESIVTSPQFQRVRVE
ncbi:MAG: DUF1592 domain-containing protein [Pirellulaceae bacterium]|nr:DUF1592 domain-containing protein [Pirellulaceae bacterium]